MLCLKVARLQKIPRLLAFYSSVFSFYTPCRAPKPLGAPPSAASLPNGVTPTGASDAAIHKRLVSNPFVGQRTHRWKCAPATSPERSEARFGTKMVGIAGVVRPHQPLLTTATDYAISPVIRRSSHGAPVRSRLGDRQSDQSALGECMQCTRYKAKRAWVLEGPAQIYSTAWIRGGANKTNACLSHTASYPIRCHIGLVARRIAVAGRRNCSRIAWLLAQVTTALCSAPACPQACCSAGMGGISCGKRRGRCGIMCSVECYYRLGYRTPD